MAERTTLSEKAVNELSLMCGWRVLVDEPMSSYTTFRIGGPADFMCSPSSPEALSRVLAWTSAEGIGRLVMGAGSNLLVSDRGIRGIVIRTNRMCAWTAEDGNLVAEAGALMPRLANDLAGMGLSGFTEACGIPGSVGGGLYMNAGAYGWNISDVTALVEAVDGSGNAMELTREEMAFGPKTSALMRDGLIATRVHAKLISIDKDRIRQKISELLEDRARKQPLELPSAGCVFRNPSGKGAGRLIDQCGLKGTSVGGAAVSNRHANFIVNVKGATARDVRELLELVARIVRETTGERLEPEVRLVGDWDVE